MFVSPSQIPGTAQGLTKRRGCCIREDLLFYHDLGLLQGLKFKYTATLGRNENTELVSQSTQQGKAGLGVQTEIKSCIISDELHTPEKLCEGKNKRAYFLKKPNIHQLHLK